MSAEQIREYRGTLKEPGKESPYRNRSIEENLELFEGMKNGEFPDGSKSSPGKNRHGFSNMNMRPSTLSCGPDESSQYRRCMVHLSMYDFAHPIEDAIEGISHSICTLEFEDHRPLYDWVVRGAGISGTTEAD